MRLHSNSRSGQASSASAPKWSAVAALPLHFALAHRTVIATVIAIGLIGRLPGGPDDESAGTRVLACASRSMRPANPPSAIESTESHSTILTMDPAPVMVQPRSTNSEGPNDKIMAKP